MTMYIQCMYDTSSLPHRLYHIAQLYIAFTIYITHALQFYVPMDFIEPPILLKLKLLDTENNKRKKVLRFLVQVAIRTFIVLIICKSSMCSKCNIYTGQFLHVLYVLCGCI